jgi:fibronectin-binding autotransporter adhesin
LSASSEYIGLDADSTASFQQIGGANSAIYIYIGASGTYTLTGGTLNINGGLLNYGTWDLSNSTAVINMSSSIIKLSGTILTTGENAVLNIDAHSLLIVPSGHSAGEYFATINNSGIIHQAGSTLNISSAYSIYGIGSIDDHVNCLGMLSTPSDHYIDLNGGLTVSGTGSVNLGNGILYVNDTISGMDGGSISAKYQYVGSTGTGTFTQTDGVNTITNTLYLGYKNKSSGTYNLSGGTNTISSCLYLGYYSGSSGTYNLSGMGQLTADKEYIGYLSGTGTFTQTGGTNTISTGLYLGINSGTGTYNLNGGKLILKLLSKGSGKFNFGGGTLTASGSFTCSVPMTLTGDGGNANVDTAGYAVTLSGALSGTGGLNKLGSGTLTLSGSETYAGDTTLNGGTLIFSGGIGSGGTSLIDVESGTAVLKTTSVSKSDLDVYTASSALFEVASGTHTIGDITGGGITKIDAGASLTAASISQATLTIGSGATVTIQAISGGPSGGAITPVPEPGTWILLASAPAGVLFFARRRHK